MKNIRNISIVAHVDHGKSTLADRMLEVTGTVEKRKMRAQVLDAMDLERERGITIKMQPVRMIWEPNHSENTNHKFQITNKSQTPNHKAQNKESLEFGACDLEFSDSDTYVLNLIDTPGHIDFAYEVSRALTAVEGVVLLIDATQGIQAQTLATLAMAREAGCVVIPALSKIDSPLARIPETKSALAALLRIPEDDIFLVSGKTGEGVEQLLEGITLKVPPPKSAYEGAGGRALVFDFEYSEHRGVVAFVRVIDGSIHAKDKISLTIFKRAMTALEVGWFLPEETPTGALSAGDIGYVVTGIKEPGIALVGDTLNAAPSVLPPFPGYQTPRPVVWASLYPESQDGFTLLKQALARLKLTDAALSFEEDGSAILGKGFRCGFLGMLHMEIITERLKREFAQTPVITAPSIEYEVTDTKGNVAPVFTSAAFPDDGSVTLVRERWVALSIITPPDYLSPLTQILYEHEAVTSATDLLGDDRLMVKAEMPLRELMRGFFDRLKSVSSGFASLSYEFADVRPAAVTRLDVLVAEEIVPALTRVVSKRRVEEEARALVLKLADTLPRQMFVLKIQAKANGRIIASRSISAIRKDVTGYLYGGDVTRKKKLLEKQKKGKERRGEYKKVNIPPEVFLKMLKPDEGN